MSFPGYVYYGHHKCGTRWILSILRHACRDLGLGIEEIHNAALARPDLPGFCRENAVDLLAYTNADPDELEGLGHVPAFHVIRDPRDLIVSAYFSHRDTHPLRLDWPELAAHRARLRALDLREGLLAEMEHSAPELGCLERWDYEQPNVLEVRMESLTAEPYDGFLGIFRHLGLLDDEPLGGLERARQVLATAVRRWVPAIVAAPLTRSFAAGRLPAERLLGIVHQNDFARKARGRRAGEEDRSSHYRKGTPGDWRNHFDPEHVATFESRWAPLLARLGYDVT